MRGEAALGKLPEAERTQWQKLWEEVESPRRRAGQTTRRHQTPRQGGIARGDVAPDRPNGTMSGQRGLSLHFLVMVPRELSRRM